ncbi:tripartite tricarboxylate transporter substrate-binding protein [Dankookia sp. P2]|uniref:tripartite tricarboxylate transporter substrate-binding protein n=1 Tax=Dankookia sp. P2 TaxID=3423955 RepID=UPI003D679B30
MRRRACRRRWRSACTPRCRPRWTGRRSGSGCRSSARTWRPWGRSPSRNSSNATTGAGRKRRRPAWWRRPIRMPACRGRRVPMAWAALRPRCPDSAKERRRMSTPTRPTLRPRPGRIGTLSRAALGIACWTALASILAPPAGAQPANPRLTMIVPASAGGSTDVIARVLGEHMARTLERSVVIENVSGGATTVASARTASSAPDGTTLLVAQLPLLAAPFLFTGLPYDTRTAFAPVGLINAGYTVLMARKGLAPSPAAAVDWLRTKGERANIGHGGIGSSGHFCALLLARALGIRPALVGYRGGGPAMSDLVGGTLDLVCDQSTNAVPQVQAGAVQGSWSPGPPASPASRRCRQRRSWPCLTSAWRYGTGCTWPAPRRARSSIA